MGEVFLEDGFGGDEVVEGLVEGEVELLGGGAGGVLFVGGVVVAGFGEGATTFTLVVPVLGLKFASPE